MNDIIIKFGILFFLGLIVVLLANIVYIEYNKEYMCSMFVGIKGDLNAERFGMEEFMSNMKLDGLEITVPCNSDGIVNLYKLRYGV